MPLLKDGVVVEDIYTDVSDMDSLPARGALLVSLNQWREDRDLLVRRDEPLGIILRSDEKPAEIEADMEKFALVALDFPGFRDGRAYSYARLLRDRYNYGGEIRAIGDVLLEQLHFMHRVGINAFNIIDKDAVRAWEIAAADISVWYQPCDNGRPSVMELRHKRG